MRALMARLVLAIVIGGCGSSDKGSGAPCDTAADCPDGEVCNPSGDECNSDVSCDDHADCGSGGFCQDGTCAENMTGGPCDDDVNCRQGQMCLGGFCGCEGVMFTAEAVPPNMLIALDRSGSMVSNDVPGTGMNRWEVAKNAVAALLDSYGGGIRFGLKLWPGQNLACDQGGDCSPGRIFVDPGEGTEGDINSDLGNADTCSYGTPITDAIESLVGDERLLDPLRPNYVVLITDGQQENCSGDPVAAVEALRDQTPSVKTFVIGFSGDVDASQLEAMAIAAGTERPGDPAYYQADDDIALDAAFDEIAGSVLSCTYVLDGTPPGDDLYVYFDGDPVDRDAADGWDYDAGSNQLTFSGAACQALRSGEVTDLVIVYGCPISVD